MMKKRPKIPPNSKQTSVHACFPNQTTCHMPLMLVKTATTTLKFLKKVGWLIG